MPLARSADRHVAVRTTVICAVWHRDSRRYGLAREHLANLRAQTRPVGALYVLDRGDVLPRCALDAGIITAERPLALYEAWNLALAAVVTPYVLNLNLDDRLCVDAIATLEAALDAGADLAGGDWRICYTRSAVNAPGRCAPADTLPFVRGWPPQPGSITRLGSGAGERGTFGPACIWRMALHQELGPYPWQFADGTPIRTIADMLWWRQLKVRGKRCVRLPTIVGSYHSHPGEQAEFRHPAHLEVQHYRRVGLPATAEWPIP
jgi:hypothetical protein